MTSFAPQALQHSAPGRRSAPARWRALGAAGLAVGVVVASYLIALARLPHRIQGVVWAEDGRIFLRQLAEQGFTGSLWLPYGGYLQFLPRVMTAIAVRFPLQDYAHVVTQLSCGVAALVAGLVFVCSGSVVASRIARVVLALVTVLVPALPVEILGNMANIHWFFLWLAPWVLLYRPTRWWVSGVLAAVMLVGVLSEIQLALFLPLALLSVRRRRSWPVTGVLLLGTVAQLVATVLARRQGVSKLAVSPADVANGFVSQVVMSLWQPHHPSAPLVWTGWGIGFAALAPFAVAAAFLVVVGLRARGRRARTLVTVAALAWGAVLPWTAAVVVNASRTFQFSTFSDQKLVDSNVLRHAVVPSMFLLALVVVAADRLIAGGRIPLVAVGVVVLAGVLALQVVHFEPEYSKRQHGPTFSTSVDSALGFCARGDTSVTMEGSPRGFSIELPCSWLVGHAGARVSG